MKKNLCVLVTLFTALVVVVGCTPTKPTPAPIAVGVPATTPTVSADDAAWAKVVATAKKEGKVNVFAYAVGMEPVSKVFKERYGIAVEFISGRGAEFVERLKTEKRTGERMGDVVLNTTVYPLMMKKEGLLASAGGELPALREKGVWWVDPVAIDPKDKTVLVSTLVVFTPYINTKLVKPEEVPKYWRDLLGPQWKGKMSFTDPNLTAGVYEYMTVLMDNKLWDEDYIRALWGQNPRIYNGLPDEFRGLARGESYLMIRGADADAGTFVQEGAPIQPIDMKEGVAVTTVAAVAVADGPHPNAARLFLNWLFTAEGQTIYGKGVIRKMVRTDVPDPRPQVLQVSINKPLVETPQQLERATQLFQEKWFNKVVGR